MKIFFNILPVLIVITLIDCTGCVSTKLSSDMVWNDPPKPIRTDYSFEEVDGGYFLSETNAIILANNSDSIKAYTAKLEALIKAMKNFYGAK